MDHWTTRLHVSVDVHKGYAMYDVPYLGRNGVPSHSKYSGSTLEPVELAHSQRQLSWFLVKNLPYMTPVNEEDRERIARLASQSRRGRKREFLL